MCWSTVTGKVKVQGRTSLTQYAHNPLILGHESQGKVTTWTSEEFIMFSITDKYLHQM